MSAHETEAYANEQEAESEQESFFNHLAAAADRSGRPQALRRIALAAAREAFRGASRSYPAVDGEGELEHELESELEAENEFEHEALLSPVAPGTALGMMEHMAHGASGAESESEAAEHFLPLIPFAVKALLPMVAKLGAKKLGGTVLRKVAPRLIRRVVPNLTRGVSQLSRNLFRNRATRPLLRAVPTIARRTMAQVARQIASGRRITPQNAARLLARQTLRTLRNPRQLQAIYSRGRRADAAYHQRAGRFIGARTPSQRPGTAGSWGRATGSCPNCGGHRPLAAPRPAYTAPQPTYAAPNSTPLAASPGCQCFRPVACAACGR